MSLTWYSIALFSAVIFASYLTIPLSMRVAFAIGAIDQPGHLKVHRQPIPRLGGLGILLTIFAVWGGIVVLTQTAMTGSFWIISCGTLLTAVLGFVDDIYSLPQIVKFVLEGILTCVVVLLLVDSPWWWLWWVGLLGIINGYNFIDGLDGLAGGTAVINLLALAVLFWLVDLSSYTLLALSCAGACLGFLRFNWQPARIFMGDGGSLSLGFLIGSLTIVYLSKTGFGWNHIIVALLIIAIPVMEVLFTFVRRFVKFKSIRPSILFAGDRDHFYDQMCVKAGLSVRATVITTYVVTFILAGLGIIAHGRSIGLAIIIGFLGLMIIGIVGLKLGIGIPKES